MHISWLNPRTRRADILGHICCCCRGCSVRCRMFSSSSSLCPLGARPFHPHGATHALGAGLSPDTIPRHCPQTLPNVPCGAILPLGKHYCPRPWNLKPRGEGSGFCSLNKQSHPHQRISCSLQFENFCKTPLFFEDQTHSTL